jgi:hypothetical protein
VEELCARLIGCEWLRDGALHAAQRRAAIVHHPVTGEACWFNDVASFSQWSVDDDERKVRSPPRRQRHPVQHQLGDGEPIRKRTANCPDTYDAVMCRAPWRRRPPAGDNVLTAHGREPTPTVEIAVAPAAPITLDQCAPDRVTPAGPACH